MTAPEDFKETIRNAVLAALDDAAGGLGVLGKSPGATDADLPALFRGLDAHADILWSRIVDQTNNRYREEALAILQGRATLLPHTHPIRS